VRIPHQRLVPVDLLDLMVHQAIKIIHSKLVYDNSLGNCEWKPGAVSHEYLRRVVREIDPEYTQFLPQTLIYSSNGE